MTRALLLCALAGAAACSSARDDATRAADGVPADTAVSGEAADTAWPRPGARAIAVHRTRALDFTGDGRAEEIRVTATGPRYDSLHIALDITDAAGDTLWREQWQSIQYFIYDDITSRDDTAVARIVRGHVDELLADDRFGMSGGLPAPLRHGGDPAAVMREAVTYHLAELDWRRQRGLRPAQPTPPDAHSLISAANVQRDRVAAVLSELAVRPSFMYYAGGEAVYAIAWSEAERAFVRIYSCC